MTDGAELRAEILRALGLLFASLLNPAPQSERRHQEMLRALRDLKPLGP